MLIQQSHGALQADNDIIMVVIIAIVIIVVIIDNDDDGGSFEFSPLFHYMLMCSP
jgi:hypothetical protein